MADDRGRKWELDHAIVFEAKEAADLPGIQKTCEGLLEFCGDDYLPMERRTIASKTCPLEVWSAAPLVPRWVKQGLAVVAEQIASETGVPLWEGTKTFLARLRSNDGESSRRCLDVASKLAIECGLDSWKFDCAATSQILERLRKFSVPYPDSPRRLFAWAFRFGQLMASHSGRAPRHEQLFTAATWATRSLDRFGVSVPTDLELKAALCISNQIVCDQSAGISISAAAVLWSQARQRERWKGQSQSVCP